MGKRQSREIPEYDAEGITTMVESIYNPIGMSASWQMSEAYHAMLGKSITGWTVTMHSALSGNLVNGNYY